MLTALRYQVGQLAKIKPFHAPNSWDYTACIAKNMKQTGNSSVVVRDFHSFFSLLFVNKLVVKK